MSLQYAKKVMQTDGVDLTSVNDDGSLNVQMVKRKQTTIQTHNAVSIGANVSSVQTNWMDTDGFQELAFTLVNDGVFSSAMDVQWSNDGSTVHGKDYVLSAAVTQYRSGSIPTKARYAKTALWNNESSGAHTMSAWAYLKA